MYQGRYVIHLSPGIIEHLFDFSPLGGPAQVHEEENWEPEETQIEMRKGYDGDYIAYALTQIG